MLKKDLNAVEIHILRAFFDYGAGSLKAHPPIGGIKKYLPKKIKNDMKTVNKSVKKLVASGYLVKHPTKENTTYALSPNGRDFILNYDL